MKIKIPEGSAKQVGTAVKLLVAIALVYAIYSAAIYAWPRVECAMGKPPLQAGKIALTMKGCWVLEDSSLHRGYKTFTFSEWPVSEDSRRIRMTLDAETDGAKLGDYTKPVTYPWGKALEINRTASTDAKARGTLLFLPELGAWLTAPDVEYLSQIESLTR